MQKSDFPIFENHPDLVYLDSAATALKPRPVIEAVSDYLECYSTNAARGLYPLAESTSARVEEVRLRVARFLGAETREIIFTSGTTAGINQVARMLEPACAEDSALIVSSSEHHSNFLPWAELAKRKGSHVRQIPSTADGFIDSEALSAALDSSVTAVALTAASNVYGAKNDIPALVSLVRKKAPRALVLVDAAQLAAHGPINVRAWDADAVAFSGHKLYGPTGIGVLWMKEAHLSRFAPSVFGGGMVLRADRDDPEYKKGPEKFEAGTLNLEGIFGLGAAIEYLEAIGFEKIAAHERELLTYAFAKLRDAFGDALSILGTADPEARIGLVSFTLQGAHPHDIASLLGSKNICVRAGEHCAAPLHRELGIPASTRLSFGLYTTKEDIDAAVSALQEARKLFA